MSAHKAKVPDHSSLKKLNPKQMIQILPIALSQVKADNKPEKIINLKQKKFQKKYVTTYRNKV